MDKEKLIHNVTEVQNGNADAWTALDNEYRPQIKRLCLSKLKNEHEADEITQETMVTAYMKIGKLEKPQQFYAWLKRIASNKCVDYYRDIQKSVCSSSLSDTEEAESLFETVVETDRESYPEMKMDADMTRELIQLMIDKLPGEQADCLRLRYFEGMTSREIAEELGENHNTVRSRLRYGESNLKKQIRNYEKATDSKVDSQEYHYSHQLDGGNVIYGLSRFSVPAVIAVAVALSLALTAFFGLFASKTNQNTTTPAAPQATKIPQKRIDLTGLRLEEAVKKLKDADIPYTIIDAASDKYKSGYVIRQETDPNKGGVILYVSRDFTAVPGALQTVEVVKDSKSNKATVTMLNWDDNTGIIMLQCSGYVGKDGITNSPSESRDATPSGTFKLGMVLTSRELGTKMPVEKVREGDVWVTDPDSAYYNTKQSKATQSDWKSSDDIFKTFNDGERYAGILIEHNGDGRTKGKPDKGSGFLLSGKAAKLSESIGDVNISEADMIKLLKLLDVSKNPTIIIR